MKSLIDDDIKESIDHSVISIKFNMMSKQISKLEEFSEELMEERNIYINRWKSLKEWLLEEQAIHTEDDNINTLYDTIIDKIESLEKQIN